MDKDKSYGPGICQYANCRKVFEKSTINQKFCCINHRKYEHNRVTNLTKKHRSPDHVENVCSYCGNPISGETTTVCIECYQTRIHKIPYYRVGEIINGFN